MPRRARSFRRRRSPARLYFSPATRLHISRVRRCSSTIKQCMVSQNPKIAVVNGGAGGIGRAVIARLARAGFFSIILDVNENAGRSALDALGGAGEFLRLELTDKAAVAAAFAEIRARHK